MRYEEARRITGRHLLLDRPGAALELRWEAGDNHALCLEQVRERAEAWRRRYPWLGPLRHRAWSGGVSLAWTAREDLLLPAVEMLEQAAGATTPPEQIAAWTAEAERPELVALLEALPPGPWFWDEDGFTFGLGVHQQTFPLDALPSPDRLPPPQTIPFVLVTGTNGKTTTTRLLAHLARTAGHRAGHTSSDGLVLDRSSLKRGDWTGPGAARALLRQPVTFAALETARGGLMRRGLALHGAAAAVVTNISADHLGEWGLETESDLAEAKLVVADGREAGAPLIYRPGAAMAEGLRRRRPAGPYWTFGGDPSAGLSAWVGDDALWLPGADGPERWLSLDEIPVTLGGLARHNAENALAAALAGRAAGLPEEALREGLRTFFPDPAQSRGRLNRFELPDGTIAVVDFAHNPDGVRRLGPLARSVGSRPLALVLGTAGDRTGEVNDALCKAVAELRPSTVVIKELPEHLRGRRLGELPALLQDRLVAHGQPAQTLVVVPDELAACQEALARATGGMALLLVHEQTEAVLRWLEQLTSPPIAEG